MKLVHSRKPSRLIYGPLEPRRVLAAYFPAYIDGTLILGDPMATTPYPLADTFNLSSRPDANQTIYLDFDGHRSNSPSWGHDITFPAFDEDGDDTQFSDGEKESIQKTFQRVAEDFAPFHVNVTTIDPGSDALRLTHFEDLEFGIRVLMTQPTDGFTNGGGIAKIGSFDGFFDTAAFVFNKGIGDGAITASHEIGHTLGLEHKGLNSEEYHPGTTNGAITWGPLLGAPFGSNAISQWTDGNYTGTTLIEDELAIITAGPGNGRLDYRSDEIADSFAGATTLNLTSDEDVIAWNFIERSSDIDMFQFNHTGGDIELAINPFADDPNLDVLAKLYDSTGTLVGTSDLLDEFSASFEQNLIAGNYYLSVEGTGRAGSYSDYGSLGFYSIHASLPEPLTSDLRPINVSFSSTGPDNLTYSFSVENSGDLPVDFATLNGEPDGPVKIDLVASTDSILGNGDDFTFWTYSQTTGVLEPDETYEFINTIDPTFDPSTYVYFGVFIDSNDRVVESDEGNNSSIQQFAASPVIVQTVRDEGDITRPDLISSYAVTFSEDVNVSAADLTIWNESALGTAVDLTGIGFHYDNASLVATWNFTSFSNPLDSAFYRFGFDSSAITSVATALTLDGNEDGVSQTTSPDNAVRQVYVAIPGDADLDGNVDIIDAGGGDGFVLVGNLGLQTGATWAMGDFDGDGDVDIVGGGGGDAFIFVANLGRNVLPPAETVSNIFSTAGTTSQTHFHSVEDSVSFDNTAVTLPDLALLNEEVADWVKKTERVEPTDLRTMIKEAHGLSGCIDRVHNSKSEQLQFRDGLTRSSGSTNDAVAIDEWMEKSLDQWALIL